MYLLFTEKKETISGIFLFKTTHFGTHESFVCEITKLFLVNVKINKV